MTCSDEAWHLLWTDFNRLTTETIRVDRGAMREVLACHDAAMGKSTDPFSSGLLVSVPRAGGTTIEVNRTTLFNLLRYHGAVCGRGVGFHAS